MHGVWRCALAAAAVLLLGACGAVTRSQVTELRRPQADARIVLMPLDVELSELTVGGLLEPKAEWTRAAAGILSQGLREEKRRLGFDLVELPAHRAGQADAALLDQLGRVHAVVGRSIMSQRYLSLPNKRQAFDWSLGPEVAALRRAAGAEYALFIHLRDSYASDGRKVVMVAAAALGVGLPGGAQIGFASLVDLRSGHIVWFNHLARNSGDLRTREAAAETIRVLLTDFPR